MISVNATLFLQLIHFLLLVFILNRLMFRPILKILEERTRYFEEIKSKMINMEEETASLTKKYSLMEKEAIKDAGNESSRLKKEAMDSAEKIFKDTRDEVLLIKERMGKEIDAKIANARQSLEDEVNNLAESIMEKVTGRRI